MKWLILLIIGICIIPLAVAQPEVEYDNSELPRVNIPSRPTDYDGNASSICGNGEVLLGEDGVLCVNLNDTIDDRAVAGSGDNSSWNQSFADTLYSPIGSGNASWNQTLGDSLYIAQSDEGNLNVNSSISLNSSEGYIIEMNYTWFDLVSSILTIDLTQLTSYIDAWLTGKTTDDLTQGSTNLYENQSWNESHADTIYVYKSGDTMTGDLVGTWFNGSWNGTSPDTWILMNGSSVTFNASRLSAVYYNGTQSELVAGTIDGGTLTDTQHSDGNYDGVTFNFSETATTPGLDLRINFTDIESFNRGVMRFKTSDLKGDFSLVQLWSYTNNEWEDYPVVAESENFATMTQPVFDDTGHVGTGGNDGTVQMRIYKAGLGNTQNHYYVDWVAISRGYGTPSGVEVDPFFQAFLNNPLFEENLNMSENNITNINTLSVDHIAEKTASHNVVFDNNVDTGSYWWGNTASGGDTNINYITTGSVSRALQIGETGVRPSTTQELSLGTSSKKFTELWLGNGFSTGVLNLDGDATISGDANVGGNVSAQNYTGDRYCNSTDCYTISDFLVDTDTSYNDSYLLINGTTDHLTFFNNISFNFSEGFNGSFGKIEGAAAGYLLLDGVNDYADTLYHAIDNPLKEYGNLSEATISIWMNHASESDAAEDTMFDNYGGGTKGGMTFRYDTAIDQFECFVTNLTDQTLVTANAVVEDEVWHHAVCRLNTTHLTIFVDGVFESAQPHTSGLGEIEEDLSIGFRGFNNDEFYKGKLDYIMFFNDSLTVAEIESINSSGVNPGSCYSDADLVSCWIFDDGTADDDTGLQDLTLRQGASVVEETIDKFQFVGDLDVDGDLTATSYADDTPAPFSIVDINKTLIKEDIKEVDISNFIEVAEWVIDIGYTDEGEIDHYSLGDCWNRPEGGRSISCMITNIVEVLKGVLTWNSLQEKRIEDLEKRVLDLETALCEYHPLDKSCLGVTP